MIPNGIIMGLTQQLLFPRKEICQQVENSPQVFFTDAAETEGTWGQQSGGVKDAVGPGLQLSQLLPAEHQVQGLFSTPGF